jgi:hypothetical protein
MRSPHWYDTSVRSVIFSLILLTISHFAASEEPTWRTVEEVLAVVGSTPILFSDVTLAALVHLVESEPMESLEDFRSRLLGARVRLEVEFRDLEDSGLLYRLDLETGRYRDALIARGGGEEALGTSLRHEGLVWPDVDELVLRVASVDAFVEQRLRPRISVTMEEIEAAYQELLVNEIAVSDEPVPPLSAVRDHLHTLLVERKLNEEIESWLERAEEHQEVMRFGR